MTSPVSHALATYDTVTPWALVNTLLRRRHVVLRCTVACMTLAVAIAFLRPRTYSVSVAFVPQGSKTAGLQGVAAQFGLSLPVGSEPQLSPAFYVELLDNTALLERVLSDSTTASETALPPLDTFFGVHEADASRREARVVIKLRDHIKPATSLKSGIVSFDVSTKSATISYSIAHRLLDAVNWFNNESRQTQGSSERRFTEARFAQAETDLHAAEDQLLEFTKANRDFRQSPTLVLQQERLVREVGFRQQLYSTLAQSLEQARISEVRDTPMISIVEAPQMPALPDSRGVILLLAIGTVVGLALGVVGAYGGELLKPRMDHRAEDETFRALWAQFVHDARHPMRLLSAPSGAVDGYHTP